MAPLAKQVRKPRPPSAGKPSERLALRGSHRRKSKGAFRTMNLPPRRDYIAPYPEVIDAKAPDPIAAELSLLRDSKSLRQNPLNDFTRDFLIEALRRRAFWEAIEKRTPVDIAGEAFLGVRRRRAEVVARELAATRGFAGWFCQKAADGVSSGAIGRARDTAPGPIANLFYETLECACCPRVFGRIRSIPEDTRDESDIKKLLIREIKEYTILRNLTGRGGTYG